MEVLTRYYATDAVRERIVEFLGGLLPDQGSCEYILAFKDDDKASAEPRHPSELPDCLRHGCDISRSLWDRNQLVVHLDIEYVNFDFPGEAYLHPDRAFQVQRPVVRAIQEVLLRLKIAPLHLLTGRGHHFVWGIRRNSRAFGELARLGRVPETALGAYALRHPPHRKTVDAELAHAFAGIGLVMEHLGFLVKQHAAPSSPAPIQLTDVEVGACDRDSPGREAVSIDISEYADPLHMRHIRVPFSAYLKPQRNRPTFGSHVVDQMPLMFQIPLFEMTEHDAIAVMRDAKQTADLARRAPVRIPDQSEASEALLADYRSSRLAAFHDWFYQQQQHSPDEWANTYDQTPINSLPSCTREVLQRPNDLLLKPAGIQHVVRVLMALGWHPRHVAGLIRSKYERDFGWGDRWYRYDAAYRADGYVRLFAGLIATGGDRLVDFNCVSNREKGYCIDGECGHNLADYRDALAARSNHERLGCGPFNRLFLQNEHL